MEWHGLLGIALLVYVPVAYLLLRAGRRRRVWAGAAATGLIAALLDADLYASGLADVGVTRIAWTGVLAVGLLAAVAAGFRPLVRGGRYTVAVTGFQVVLLGLVSRLLAGVVAPVGEPPVYPVYAGASTMTFVEASDADVNAGLLVVGLVTFLLALGYARMHGPIGPAAEDDSVRWSAVKRKPRGRFEREQRRATSGQGYTPSGRGGDRAAAREGATVRVARSQADSVTRTASVTAPEGDGVTVGAPDGAGPPKCGNADSGASPAPSGTGN